MLQAAPALLRSAGGFEVDVVENECVCDWKFLKKSTRRNSDYGKTQANGKIKTKLDAIEWAKKGQDLGAGEILMTSMDKDGTKSGFDNNLYMELSNNLSIPVIASGGAGELSHLVDAVKLGKADALLAASIFHYEEISIKKVKQALQTEGFEVRL